MRHSIDPKAYTTDPCTENQQVHINMSGLSWQNGSVAKGAAPKPDDQHSVPQTHMVEGEK